MSKLHSGFGRGQRGSGGKYVLRGGRLERVGGVSGAFNATASPDYSKGPLTMYSEFRKQDAPQDLKWHRHDRNGYVQVADERERVEYQQRANDAGIPVEWTR